MQWKYMFGAEKMQRRRIRTKKPHGAPTLPPFLGGPVISRFGVATVEMEI